MSVQTQLYNAIFKRTSTFVLAVAAGTFVFERTFDAFADYIWERNNKGVCIT